MTPQEPQSACEHRSEHGGGGEQGESLFGTTSDQNYGRVDPKRGSFQCPYHGQPVSPTAPLPPCRIKPTFPRVNNIGQPPQPRDLPVDPPFDSAHVLLRVPFVTAPLLPPLPLLL